MTAYDVSTNESRLETYKVYTHVFDKAGAAPVTKGAGGLFPQHRGIFLGWSKTKFGGKGIDSWHMKGCVQVYQKILSQETTDDSAKLKLSGVDVASFADAMAVTPNALDVVYTDPVNDERSARGQAVVNA